jgi:hypothetical protein
MNRIHPECSDSDLFDRSLGAEALLRQEPDNEGDEEEDEGDRKEDDEDDHTDDGKKEDDDDDKDEGYSESACLYLFSG